MFDLSQRVKKIIELAMPYQSIADIGTDHGHVPNHIFNLNPDKKIIATDISKKCLDKSIGIASNHDANKIDHRIGDGLEPLTEGEVECIIISGMGGMLIKSIIERDEKVARSSKCLLLQPMNASEELRKYFKEKNWGIVGEELVKEGRRVYEIIIVDPHRPFTDPLLVGGKLGFLCKVNKHPLLNDYITWRLSELYRILNLLEQRENIKNKDRLEEVKREIKAWEENRHEGL